MVALLFCKRASVSSVSLCLACRVAWARARSPARAEEAVKEIDGALMVIAGGDLASFELALEMLGVACL